MPGRLFIFLRVILQSAGHFRFVWDDCLGSCAKGHIEKRLAGEGLLFVCYRDSYNGLTGPLVPAMNMVFNMACHYKVFHRHVVWIQGYDIMS